MNTKIPSNPTVCYRFKDSMGCVTYGYFNSELEAETWYEKNKKSMELYEIGKVEYVCKHKIII